MMEKVLYSKYSNERSTQFQIRTDILEDEKGHKVVRKGACTPQAKEHIRKVYEWSQKLDKSYEGTKLITNQCRLENDSLYFEFLEGQTFEEHLDEYLKENDYPSIISEITNFFEMLKKTLHLQPFRMTEEFRSVYGDIEFPEMLQAADLNNIDYIFGNIFMGEDKWTIIDYEWTFDFPIPYLYIVYRAVHYYTYDPSRAKLAELGLLRMLGVTKELEECFEWMEHRFQLYILGGITPVINMYPTIAGCAYPLDAMEKHESEQAKLRNIKIYFDYGEGFNEEQTTTMRPLHYDVMTGYASYRIPVSQAKAVRIDPVEESCILKIGHLLGNGVDNISLDFTTNGTMLKRDTYIFGTSDPSVIISELPAGVLEIQFLCRCDLLCKEAAIEAESAKRKLSAARKEQASLKKQLDDLSQHCHAIGQQMQMLQAEKAAADARYMDAENRYQAVLRSFGVRMMWPLRMCKKAVKKILKSNKVTYKFAKGVKCLKENGISYTYGRLKKKINAKRRPKIVWKMSEKEKKEQRNRTFTKDVCFSVIVPLYNTPENFLREMIESVQNQTYGKWELCLADGSDAEHSYVGKICNKYAAKDARVKYKKLENNEGISENTNRCLEMATGNYIALFDHDDLLHPSALYENMCVIEEQDADFIYSDEDTFSETPLKAYCPHHKPDFSPDTLRSYNYICHFSVFKRSLLDQVGMFRKEFDGSQDYDMILRLTEKAEKIAHIPKIIYLWRAHGASVASDISAKMYCLDAAKKALTEHLERVGLKGEVMDASIPSVYRMKYDIEGEPLISILIPNKDYVEDLSKCIDAILEKSTYRNFEIIVIENNSEEEETFSYYRKLERMDQVRVVYWEEAREFNYSALNNFGASFAKGEYLLLLNNDIEVITPDWLQEMLMFAQRKDVGAVGAKLYYPDNTVQHAGIIVGIGGVAGHSHKNFARDAYGYSSRLQLAQNLSAVTAACMLIRRDVFDEVNGLDEGFKVAFNDVDLCMKIREAGYLIVFTPFAELYHYESKSRGLEDNPEKVKRFQGEIQRFYSKWDPVLEKGDPYYNPNLTLRTEDFAIKDPNEGRIRA